MIALLASRSVREQEHAAGALRNLSANAAIMGTIVAAGGIPPFIALL